MSEWTGKSRDGYHFPVGDRTIRLPSNVRFGCGHSERVDGKKVTVPVFPYPGAPPWPVGAAATFAETRAGNVVSR